MQIEHVARISLTSRWTSNQQRHLTISSGLFRQVIVKDNRMHTVVTEIFTHSCSGVRGNKLQWSCFRSSGCNHNGIIHSAIVAQSFYHLCYRRAFLTNGNINAKQFFAVIFCHVISAFLIDDCINNNRSLTGLTVANNQLTLTASNRNKRINSFQSGLYRFMHAFSRNNARSFNFSVAILLGFYAPHAVNRVAQSVNHTA